MGRAVEAIKPVVSGYDPSQAGDQRSGGAVRRSACRSPSRRSSDLAVAVPRAAVARSRGAREGRSIDVDEVIAFCQNAIEHRKRACCSSKASAASWCRSTSAHGPRLMMALAHAAHPGGRRLSRHHQPHAHRARLALPRDMKIVAIIVSERRTRPCRWTTPWRPSRASPVDCVPRRRRGGPPAGAAGAAHSIRRAGARADRGARRYACAAGR